MLEKIKSAGLTWKFGVGVLAGFVLVIAIVLVVLQGSLNTKFDALYGALDTKGQFVAEHLANEIEPLLENGDVNSAEVHSNLQQTVDSHYTAVRGTYSVSYMLVQGNDGFILADTFKESTPAWLIEKNPVDGKRHCVGWRDRDAPVYTAYYDCAVPITLSDGNIGAVRAGVWQYNPQSSTTILQQFKAEHVSGVVVPLVFLSIVLILLVTLLLTAAFWYLLIRRIFFLAEITEKMSFGELEVEVPVKGHDELGSLEETMERMRANLNEAIERLKERLKRRS
jgi:HAMP domain-containing protein